MKKVLSLTIALCLIFASVVPSYAEAWGTGDVSYVRNSLATIVAQILEINSKMGAIDGNGNSVLDNISLQLAHLESWLVPTGANTGTATLMDSIIVLTNYAMNHLPSISVISGYVASWMSQNNSYLNTISSLDSQLRNALSNVAYYTSTFNQQESAHLQLPYVSDNTSESYYRVYQVGANGTNTLKGVAWINGTPLGNIAVLLNTLIENHAKAYNYTWAAALTDYTGQLGIWDSQGDTLTQEAWSPTSAINGLYKYLAYTQRDVARLTYVLASDEEIETREKAKATQTAVMDDFIEPEGDGAASVDDFGSISDASSGVKSNFNTGVSAGGVWNVFERNYEWFSQETADNLAYQPQRSTRNLKAVSDQEYDTPYLDSYYEELHDIIGF